MLHYYTKWGTATRWEVWEGEMLEAALSHSGFRTVKHTLELCLEKNPEILATKVFKARLAGALSNLGYGECPCPWQGWIQRSSKVPLQPKPSHDPVILLTHWF